MATASPTTLRPTPEYPSSSPNVVSVGGTTLTVSGSNPNYTYGGETAWGDGVNSDNDGGSGGGISGFTRSSHPIRTASSTNTAPPIAPSPTWRWRPHPATGSTGLRYLRQRYSESLDQRRSAARASPRPCGPALVAIADEGRAIAGLGSLNGLTQTLPELYSLPAADFHDITSGSTGPSPTVRCRDRLRSDHGTRLARRQFAHTGADQITSPTVTGISPATGPSTGGTAVTITGTDFNGGTRG